MEQMNVGKKKCINILYDMKREKVSQKIEVDIFSDHQT